MYNVPTSIHEDAFVGLPIICCGCGPVWQVTDDGWWRIGSPRGRFGPLSISRCPDCHVELTIKQFDFRNIKMDRVVVDDGRTAIYGKIKEVTVVIECVGYHDQCDEPITETLVLTGPDVIGLSKKTHW